MPPLVNILPKRLISLALSMVNPPNTFSSVPTVPKSIFPVPALITNCPSPVTSALERSIFPLSLSVSSVIKSPFRLTVVTEGNCIPPSVKILPNKLTVLALSTINPPSSSP